MEPELKKKLSDAKKLMDKAIAHLEKELLNVKAGKLTPALLDPIKVPYYGAEVPLRQIANVASADARTLLITPYEKNMIPTIEKALRESDLGISPVSDNKGIRLVAPQLTEERRKELVKQVKKIVEQARVSVRNVRRDIRDAMKRLKKEGLSEDSIRSAENELQKITNQYTKKIDTIFKRKEQEIMKV